MSTDIFSGSGAIIAWIGGIAVLAGYMWQLLKGVNNRNEARDLKKEEALKKTTEDNAAHLKKATEDIADNIKEQAEERASELKTATQEIADRIKREADTREVLVRSYTDKTMDGLKAQIADVDRKVMETLSKQQDMLSQQQSLLGGLTKRSDMVNGNIANIRGDLIEIDDAVDELYTKIRQMDNNNNDNNNSRKRSPIHDEEDAYDRARKRNMREKRKRIDADRIAQSEKTLSG